MLANLLLATLAFAFTIKTSIYDMVGMSSTEAMSELRSGTDDKVVLICTSSKAERSRQVVMDFLKALPMEYVLSEDRDSLPDASLLADKVCHEDAELLSTKEGRAKIAKKAIRRYVSSPMPPMFSPAEDPFCLKERFLASLASDRVAIQTFTLPPAVVGDIDRLIDVVDDLRGRIAAANAASAGGSEFVLSMTGVPVHTAITAGECRRQIGYLTWFSLAFIALLSVFVFRSVKWIPLLALSLAVSCLAGAAALFLCFDSVHLMTLVFGTTVLGLVIDYSFHWLLSPKRDSALRRNLVVSWLTTEISLLPLILSTLPVLRQTAVFLAVALAAALAFVLLAYPKKTKAITFPLLTFPLLTFSLFLFPFSFLHGCSPVQTNPASIYHSPEELAAADRMLAEKWMTGAGASEDIAKLYAEQGEKVKAALGLKEIRFVRPVAAKGPRQQLEKLLNELTRETLERLSVALVMMFFALLFFFRRRAVRTFLPSALALGAMFAIVLLSEGVVNLFHLLAMFLLAGMSIDYTVFLHNGGKEARRPAACSLFTSMAGFGALYFVSFPVVSAFGLVLGLGLPLSFVLALALAPRLPKDEESVEKAVSPIGLEILFLVYRLFGLSFLHGCAAAVGATIWCCSGSVRSSSPRLRKVINFTRSLADKLVVMAGGRRLPKVVAEGSEDAQAFIADVQSGKGVFVLSSHVGTIEVLTALGECSRTFHAWMDFDRTGVFNRFYLNHAKRNLVVIHPISEFGMGTVFEAGDYIDGGDCLLMAGDRGDGAFSFAAAFDHPIYFVSCIAERDGHYKVVVHRLPQERKAMKNKYDEILSSLIAIYPEQHYVWNDNK